jgi:peptide/nickel transport system substrate-binding protein
MTDESGGQRLQVRLPAVPVSRRNVLKASVLGAGLLGAGSLIAACGSGASSTTTQPASTGPKRGGTLTAGIGGGGPSDTMDPDAGVVNTDWARIMNLYNGLVQLEPDFTLKYYLADEIIPNATATSFTIRVKKGVTFHNGKDLTADDVIFTLQRIANPKAPLNGAGGLSYVDTTNLKKVDSHTVEVPMHIPFLVFPEMLADFFYFIAPVGWDSKQPVGTGPFKFESFEAGVESVFTRNENYFEDGLPYIDSVKIVDYPELSSRVNAMESGAADCVDQLPASSLSTFKNTPSVKVLRSRNSSWTPIVMQENLAPFQDNRVRMAMRLIVDRPQMIASALDGYGQVGNDFFGLYDPTYDYGSPQRHQDIDQAKALLKAAGQSDLMVTLDTSPAANGLVEAAQVFAQQAKLAGVTVNINLMATSNYFGPTYLHRPFSQSFWTGNYYLGQVTESNLPNSLDNEPHFINEHYLSLFKQANAEFDVGKRTDLIHEMQLIDHNEGGYLIYAFPDVLDAYSSKVHGFVEDKIGWSLSNYGFKNVWFE